MYKIFVKKKYYFLNVLSFIDLKVQNLIIDWKNSKIQFKREHFSPIYHERYLAIF